MSFSERAKLKALAIVHIFETSKPFGDYGAVAVLNDGAGISYGINQFTHKSGSLWKVLNRFRTLGGELPASVVEAMADFQNGRNIVKRSNDKTIRTALKNLGKNELMQRAQREIAFEAYLKPAIDACEGSGFVMPLSLAVIYDSINHGSYAKIRDRVDVKPPGNGSMKPEEFEMLWISQYVRKRDQWLESIPRLAPTDYRTDFFLAQIARGNWQLKLPLNVHGFTLTDEHISISAAATPDKTASSATNNDVVPHQPVPADPGEIPQVNQIEQPPIVEQKDTVVKTEGDQTFASETTVTQPKGDPPEAPPTPVTKNGPLSKWLTGGGLAAIGTFAWTYIQSNPSAVAIVAICVTALILALVFRGAITDAIRMQTAADPDKKNVT
jgi:hypothetical protein